MNAYEEPSFLLQATHGEEAPTLAGVEFRGRLDGVLLSMTLRQTYRNAGTQPLEVLYTFPLPHEAVLLGMAAEFDGRRLEGEVLPAGDAETVYEAALADGDAPVLLEAGRDGLHTANLGNLKPGETVTLELRFAQLLAFEQGRLRVAIPTTIAPRYGSAERAGLQPHQAPETSITAEYPLSVTLAVCGSLARGRIECPTHAHRILEVQGGPELQLLPGARLDRDLVVVVTPGEPQPGLLTVAADAEGLVGSTVALAAFGVPARPSGTALCARLLVDCSGSMGGDSIASARAALTGVLDGLDAEDEASLSRFGGTVRHVVGAGACGTLHRQRLAQAIAKTDADLGGTEMEAALRSVFAAWPRKGRRVDVLLITDGEVWQSDELVEAARRSGHRIFAIGVGGAPAESVLRRIAEATGGAAEFVTPGEAVERAAQRMLGRMRQVPASGLSVDWGVEPAWQLPLPGCAFGGDTVLALAGFDGQVPRRPARLLELGLAGRPVELARTAHRSEEATQDLVRVAVARRLPHCGEEEQLMLALAYELLTPLTRFVLVDERSAEDRVTETARLQKVPGMLAAGWGATSKLRSASRTSLDSASDSISFSIAPPPDAVWHSMRSDRLSAKLESMDFDDMLMEPVAAVGHTPRIDPLLILMGEVAEFLLQGGAVDDLVVAAQDWAVPDNVEEALQETDRLDVGRATAWLLLAQWIAARGVPPEFEARATGLRAHPDDADPAQRQAAFEVFDRIVARQMPPEPSGRAARLRERLGRI